MISIKTQADISRTIDSIEIDHPFQLNKMA